MVVYTRSRDTGKPSSQRERSLHEYQRRRRKRSVRTQGVRITLEKLKNVPTLHTALETSWHFVVCYKIKERKFYIADRRRDLSPIRGRSSSGAGSVPGGRAGCRDGALAGTRGRSSAGWRTRKRKTGNVTSDSFPIYRLQAGDGTARAGHGDSQRTATHPHLSSAELGRYRYTGQQPRFHCMMPYIAIGDLYRQAIRGTSYGAGYCCT